MAKVINFQTSPLLIPFFFEEDYRKSFNDSELGKIYKHIPWNKIVREIDKKLTRIKRLWESSNKYLTLSGSK